MNWALTGPRYVKLSKILEWLILHKEVITEKLNNYKVDIKKLTALSFEVSMKQFSLDRIYFKTKINN